MDNLSKALEEMEKAAAAVETSYESELDDSVASDKLENSLFTPVEAGACLPDEVTLSEPSPL